MELNKYKIFMKWLEKKIKSFEIKIVTVEDFK